MVYGRYNELVNGDYHGLPPISLWFFVGDISIVFMGFTNQQI
jgi:hypothetical protein